MIPTPPEPLRALYLALALGFLALSVVSFIQHCHNKRK